MPWPAWSAQALAAALAACALAADGVPAGWAIAQSAVASVADAGRVLLPACLVATGKGARPRRHNPPTRTARMATSLS